MVGGGNRLTFPLGLMRRHEIILHLTFYIYIYTHFPMAKKKNSRKIRVDFRKNRTARTRDADLTRDVQQERFQEDDTRREERIRGRGTIFRQRTIHVEHTPSETPGEDTLSSHLRVTDDARLGVVLRVHGLNTLVEELATGQLYRCAVRRLLRTLATSHRHVVVAGDTVQFRPAESDAPAEAESISPHAENFSMETLPEGVIERVEPRHACLCRTSRGRQHTLVANIDQAVLVASAAAPGLKPNLLDRMIIMAEKMGIRPVLCINKVDLIDKTRLMPLVGMYARMGYESLLASAATGEGVAQLRHMLQQPGVRSVVTGQSGVGKSSLLNAVEPGLNLRTRAVSEENEKGRHTTSAAELIKLAGGGYVVDTPGIRQFELWDVIPAEVANFFRDIRPYCSLCRFPDCTHTHEIDCAVKEAVEEGYIDARRYMNYCQIMAGDVHEPPEEEEI